MPARLSDFTSGQSDTRPSINPTTQDYHDHFGPPVSIAYALRTP